MDTSDNFLVRRHLRAIGCAVGLLVGLAGCNSGDEGSRTITAVQDPIIRDIPKPAGFSLVDKNSMARSSGQFRIARCEYSGGTDRTAVQRFYEQNMPAAGFELRHSSFDKGTVDLQFESASEICNVKIYPSGLRTRVVVEVGPRAQGSTERQPPPLRRTSNP